MMPNNEPLETKEVSEIHRRAVLLVKDEMLAIIALTRTPRGSTVASRDPRCLVPSVHSFSDPRRARSIFLRTVRSSLRHGWRVFYDGPPLKG